MRSEVLPETSSGAGQSEGRLASKLADFLNSKIRRGVFGTGVRVEEEDKKALGARKAICTVFFSLERCLRFPLRRAGGLRADCCRGHFLSFGNFVVSTFGTVNSPNANNLVL